MLGLLAVIFFPSLGPVKVVFLLVLRGILISFS